MSAEKNSKTDSENQDQSPEIFVLKQGKQNWEFSRREFIATMGISAGVMATGCVVPSALKSQFSNEPVQTSTPSAIITPRPMQTATEQPAIESAMCKDALAHTSEIEYLGFTPNGNLLISGDTSGHIKFWSMPQVTFEDKLKATLDCTHVVLSQDSSKLAVSGGLPPINIFSIPDSQLNQKISFYGLSINSMDFTPDGNSLIVSCDERKICIYDVNTGDVLKTYEDFPTALKCMALNPGGDLLAIAYDYVTCAIELRSFPDFQVIHSFTLNDVVQRMVFSNDGNSLFLYIQNGKIIQWNIQEGKAIKEVMGYKGFALSSDDSRLIYQDDDQVIRIYSLEQKREIATFGDSFTGHISSVAISPDGNTLAAGNTDGIMYVWSLQSGALYSCPVDLKDLPDEFEGITYEITDKYGNSVSYTLPCGVPIPDGAVCVCNCVAGSECGCVGHGLCDCVGHNSCSCVGHGDASHYWYPN